MARLAWSQNLFSHEVPMWQPKMYIIVHPQHAQHFKRTELLPVQDAAVLPENTAWPSDVIMAASGMSGTTHSDLVTITNFIAGGVALKVKKQTATCLAPMKVDKDLCYYNTSLFVYFSTPSIPHTEQHTHPKLDVKSVWQRSLRNCRGWLKFLGCWREEIRETDWERIPCSKTKEVREKRAAVADMQQL